MLRCGTCVIPSGAFSVGKCLNKDMHTIIGHLHKATIWLFTVNVYIKQSNSVLVPSNALT